MGHLLRRASLSLVLLGDCIADRSADLPAGETDDLPTSAAVEPSPPSARCDGTPLPVCDGPFTGATCELPCAASHDPAPASCGVDFTCHSDGRIYGLSTRNAVLYPASPEEPDSMVEADLETRIAGHPAELGLSTGLSVDDLELHRVASFRSSAGPLTIFRFAQTYRGLPVLAPDGIVTLVYAPQGAIAVARRAGSTAAPPIT